MYLTIAHYFNILIGNYSVMCPVHGITFRDLSHLTFKIFSYIITKFF